MSAPAPAVDALANLKGTPDNAVGRRMNGTSEQDATTAVSAALVQQHAPKPTKNKRPVKPSQAQTTAAERNAQEDSSATSADADVTTTASGTNKAHKNAGAHTTKAGLSSKKPTTKDTSSHPSKRAVSDKTLADKPQTNEALPPAAGDARDTTTRLTVTNGHREGQKPASDDERKTVNQGELKPQHTASGQQQEQKPLHHGPPETQSQQQDGAVDQPGVQKDPHSEAKKRASLNIENKPGLSQQLSGENQPPESSIASNASGAIQAQAKTQTQALHGNVQKKQATSGPVERKPQLKKPAPAPKASAPATKAKGKTKGKPARAVQEKLPPLKHATDPFDVYCKLLQHDMDSKILEIMEDYRLLFSRTLAAENAAYGNTQFVKADIKTMLCHCLDRARDSIVQALRPQARGTKRVGKLANAEMIRFEQSLHRACREGDVDRCKQLIEQRGVSIHALTWDCKTPLYIAVDSGCYDVVTYLLSQKADVDYLCGDDSQAEAKETALHAAARNNDHKMVQLLLEHSAQRFMTNGANETPYSTPELGIRTWVALHNAAGADRRAGIAAKQALEEKQRQLALEQAKREQRLRYKKQAKQRARERAAAAAMAIQQGDASADGATTAEQGQPATNVHPATVITKTFTATGMVQTMPATLSQPSTLQQQQEPTSAGAAPSQATEAESDASQVKARSFSIKTEIGGVRTAAQAGLVTGEKKVKRRKKRDDMTPEEIEEEKAKRRERQKLRREERKREKVLRDAAAAQAVRQAQAENAGGAGSAMSSASDIASNVAQLIEQKRQEMAMSSEHRFKQAVASDAGSELGDMEAILSLHGIPSPKKVTSSSQHKPPSARQGDQPASTTTAAAGHGRGSATPSEHESMEAAAALQALANSQPLASAASGGTTSKSETGQGLGTSRDSSGPHIKTDPQLEESAGPSSAAGPAAPSSTTSKVVSEGAARSKTAPASRGSGFLAASPVGHVASSATQRPSKRKASSDAGKSSDMSKRTKTVGGKFQIPREVDLAQKTINLQPNARIFFGAQVNRALAHGDQNVWNKHRTLYRYQCSRREVTHFDKVHHVPRSDLGSPPTLLLAAEIDDLVATHPHYRFDEAIKQRMAELKPFNLDAVTLDLMKRRSQKKLEQIANSATSLFAQSTSQTSTTATKGKATAQAAASNQAEARQGQKQQQNSQHNSITPSEGHQANDETARAATAGRTAAASSKTTAAAQETGSSVQPAAGATETSSPKDQAIAAVALGAQPSEVETRGERDKAS